MKRITGFCLLFCLSLIPGIAAAQNWVACGALGPPKTDCKINAQISNGQLVLSDSTQEYVQVPIGVQILWSVSGVSYFLVAMDINSVVFGATPPFFLSTSSSSPVGGMVTNPSSTYGDHYFIYAVDGSGKKYVLDPKVRTNSGFPRPTGRR